MNGSLDPQMLHGLCGPFARTMRSVYQGWSHVPGHACVRRIHSVSGSSQSSADDLADRRSRSRSCSASRTASVRRSVEDPTGPWCGRGSDRGGPGCCVGRWARYRYKQECQRGRAARLRRITGWQGSKPPVVDNPVPGGLAVRSSSIDIASVGWSRACCRSWHTADSVGLGGRFETVLFILSSSARVPFKSSNSQVQIAVNSSPNRRGSVAAGPAK